MKIAISSGHTPTAQGASRGLITEYGITSAIVGDLVFRLTKSGHEVWLIGADSNAKQVERINELYADIGLELHFNSFYDPSMNGTEVLHAGSEKGESLARLVQLSLVNRLKTQDRGVKIGFYRGDTHKPIIEILRKTNCPFIVPEPLFLSNDEDFSKLDTAAISIALHDGIQAYSL